MQELVSLESKKNEKEVFDGMRYIKVEPELKLLSNQINIRFSFTFEFDFKNKT